MRGGRTFIGDSGWANRARLDPLGGMRLAGISASSPSRSKIPASSAGSVSFPGRESLLHSVSTAHLHGKSDTQSHRRRPVPGSVAHVGTTVTITPAPISNSFCSRQIERKSLKTAHCIDYSSAKNKSKAHIEIQRVLLSRMGFDDYSSAKNKSKGAQ
jgi:hypothetical protein